MEPSDAKRLQDLEDENGKLKRLLAEQMLDNAMLRYINSKNGDARWEAQSGGAFDGGPSGQPATGVRCAAS
jgi:putative transposase